MSDDGDDESNETEHLKDRQYDVHAKCKRSKASDMAIKQLEITSPVSEPPTPPPPTIR